ncbi:hypothetical protein [Candidatus Thioglobus sp.]|uniref:hypothetical protein n=1 Tax=Candidatus Thioglobus sp. TaxID=2026721 RepID=UPI002627AF96|nr:hypothetical protein [Candidatus Thioglobus sp.]MDG2395854.1 hypothetical protein [Candidatus Thioglobus sp.]
MAYTTLTLKNPKTQETRIAPVGYSWTSLCLFFCPAIYRRDWKSFALMLPLCILTLGLANIVFFFTYNQLYVKHLLSQGYIITIHGVGGVRQSNL